jgi:hypothetical protein
LGWEHEDGQVGTGEDGSMEKECGDASDFLVVLCFQKILIFLLINFQKQFKTE